MNTELEQKIKEFIEISDKCPEKYQLKCFELLVGNYLASNTKKEENNTSQSDNSSDLSKNLTPPKQTELTLSDLHVKVKSFLQKSNLTLEVINSVFYKEGDSILLLVDDLKAVKSSEVQIRIALLNAFVSAINTGNFEFDGEEVRAETQKRKAYDKANFAANFKNNSSLFEEISSYNKTNPIIKLTESGKERIAELIKELA